MKPKLLLCLALALSVGLLGCATDAQDHHDFRPLKVADMAKVKLKLANVDSEETDGQDNGGENAVDGNPDTYWHTQWQGTSPGFPHEIIIELCPPSIIKGFTYLPRQDVSDHGTIKDYEFYVSDDGTNFGRPVKKGAFEPGKAKNIEIFEPIKCRFIKLKAISEIHGLPWTSAAEIGVIQSTDFAPIGSSETFWSELAEFKESKSVEQLERALRLVEGIPFPEVDKTVEAAIARREQAKMWLALLAAIEQSIDTNYDVNNPTNWATINLIPPPTAKGMRYPSGVDPKDIKEPEVRAKYEAALKLNDERMVRANVQTRMRNLNLLAVLDAERFFSSSYTTSKDDQSEVENLGRQIKLSPERTEKLKALFEPAKPVPLDFLADIPSMKDISLQMSEAELLDIIRLQKLDYTHRIEHEDSMYYVRPKEHVVVIITFREGHCGGIQRLRD